MKFQAQCKELTIFQKHETDTWQREVFISEPGVAI